MRIEHGFVFGLISILTFSCGPAGKNKTGHEYMPDMYHSIAYESNYFDYYSWNTWGGEEEYYEMAMPRTQVEGTIPFGHSTDAKTAHTRKKMFQTIPKNGQVPYYYANTEEERTRASEQILNNPFPISADGIARGKELYTIFCGICHGDKAQGNGYLVRDDGGVYPAQPANLVNEEFTAASVGRFYHAIMHGKNVMLGYSDKLSYEERWQVIHYIRSLQAKELDLVYSEDANTLNAEAIPSAELVKEDIAEVTSEIDHSHSH